MRGIYSTGDVNGGVKFFYPVIWRNNQIYVPMNSKKHITLLFFFILAFLLLFFMPLENERFSQSIIEALALAKWYAREHVILCLIPAFFIAGAISVFLGKASVIKYLGAKSHKILAFSVASISGTILAVCSCTVLPLFAGIYRMGAGLGPAVAFLYSGPAINVLAIILTARVLGIEMGIARALGSIFFSIIIGIIMHFIFIKEEMERINREMAIPDDEVSRPLWQNAVFFGSMIAILVFANWGKPQDTTGLWYAIYAYKWLLTALAGSALGFLMFLWFRIAWFKILVTALLSLITALLLPHQPMVAFTVGVAGLTISASTTEGESTEWVASTWGFSKQILPLLFFGVILAGLLLGRPGHEGLIPSIWVESLVGDNSLTSNFFASIIAAFMYFATLTEVPILQGLLGSGMGKGPALALLLAGPAVSLPNMLVIRSIMGTKKTIVFVLLVVIMATIMGMFYGYIFG